jgi:hypothetical protein
VLGDDRRERRRASVALVSLSVVEAELTDLSRAPLIFSSNVANSRSSRARATRLDVPGFPAERTTNKLAGQVLATALCDFDCGSNVPGQARSGLAI